MQLNRMKNYRNKKSNPIHTADRQSSTKDKIPSKLAYGSKCLQRKKKLLKNTPLQYEKGATSEQTNGIRLLEFFP